MDVNERLIWLNGELLRVSDAKINVLSPTAQFGLNVFEGIPCYWNEDKKQLFAFRLDDHYKRLQLSARLLGLECPYSIDEMKQALVDVVRANDYHEDLAVRQTLFCDGFGSWGASEPVGMFVAPIPRKNTSAEYHKEGLKCCVSSWRRISDDDFSPRIKCGANYINSRLAQREALRNGYDTAIFLNKNGNVSEAPGSCVFIIKDEKLITPILSDGILKSITRDTIIKLAKDMGISCEERTMNRIELYEAEGAFLCGSSMGLTPIVGIDGYRYKETNSILIELEKAYCESVRGANRKWVYSIFDENR